MHWMKSETTLIEVVNGNARSFAFSTSYFLKICSEIALHLDHSRAAGNDKRYPCVGWKSLMFITFSTIWEQIVVMNLRRRTFVNWITDMTLLWGKKDVNLSEMCCFFPQDLNYCPASVNPSWIICFPRTPTDKLTKRQPKLEALKVGPAPREASCLHGNPPIPKMMTRHPIPSPSVDKETGSGGLNTRQQQQEGLNTKYNTALLPPPPPPSVYFIFCLSLPSRQLWLVNICRGSNLYLRKHREEELMLDYQSFFIHLSINWGILQWCRPRIVHAGRPTRLSGAGLQHHQPVVHLLQDFLVDGLCDVCQLERVRCHVVDFYKHLQRTNNPGWDSNCFSPPRSWFYHQMAPQWGIF